MSSNHIFPSWSKMVFQSFIRTESVCTSFSQPMPEFCYQASLPYRVETESEAQENLDSIISNLLTAVAGDDLCGVRGTQVGPLSTRAVRDLRSWLKYKYQIPFDKRCRITEIMWELAFLTTEPVLFERFANACALLWRSRRHRSNLRPGCLRIDWSMLVNATVKYLIGSSELVDPVMSSALKQLGKTFSAVAPTEDGERIFNEIMRRWKGPFHNPDNDLAAVLGVVLPSTNFGLVSKFFILRDEGIISDMQLLHLLASFLHQQTLCVDISKAELDPKQMSAIFTAILKVIGVPTAGSRKHSKSALSRQSAHAIATDIVCTLPVSLDYLETLVHAVESYCHPSNSGSWTLNIFHVLSELLSTLVSRLNRQNNKEIPISIPSNLGHKVVHVISQILFFGLQSKIMGVTLLALNVLQNSVYLAPNVLIPTLLRDVYAAFQAAGDAQHRAVTSIALLSHIVRAMVQEPRWALHLTTLLELTLPYIDANEPHKALLGMVFFHTSALMVPFDDVSEDGGALAQALIPQVVESLDQPVEIGWNAVYSSSCAFPEIASSFLSRVFDLIENLPDKKPSDGPEAILLQTLPSAIFAVINSCSETIFKRLLEQTHEYLGTSQTSGDALAQICGAFVRARPECFQSFWSFLAPDIEKEIRENGAASSRGPLRLRDKPLVRYLNALNMCLLAAGDQILLVKDEVKRLLLFLRENSKGAVIYNTANTLHHSVSSLTSIYARPTRPQRWGHFIDLKNESVQIEWHHPTPAEIELAQELYSRHIMMSINGIKEAKDMPHKRPTEASDLICGHLVHLRTVTAAASSLPPNVSSSIREQTGMFLMNLELDKDDVGSRRELLFALHVWIGDFGFERSARPESHQSSLYHYETKCIHVPGLRKQLLPPGALSRRAYVYHLTRISQRRPRATTELERKILHVIVEESCSRYPAVRRNAFSALFTAAKCLKDSQEYVYPLIIAKTKSLLSNMEFEMAEGGLQLLNYRTLTMVRKFGPALGFYELSAQAASADNRMVNTAGFILFTVNSADAFRLPVDIPHCGSGVLQGVHIDETEAEVHRIQRLNKRKEAESEFSTLAHRLEAQSLIDCHWRLAVVNTLAMLGLQSPQAPLRPKMLEQLLLGASGAHPDVRRSSILALQQAHAPIFRRGLGPRDMAIYQSGSPEPPVWDAPHGWSSRRSQEVASFELDEKTLHAVKEYGKCITCEILSRMYELQRVEPREEEDKVATNMTRIWTDIVTFCCYGLTTVTIRDVCNMVESTNLASDDHNWHRAAAELCLGLAKAVSRIPSSYHDRVIDVLKRVLEDVLSISLTYQNFKYWATFWRQAFAGEKSVLLEGLVELLRSHAAKPSESVRNSLCLNLWSELLRALPEDGPQALHLQLAHPLESGRDAVSQALANQAIREGPRIIAEEFQRLDLSDLRAPKTLLSALSILLDTYSGKAVVATLPEIMPKLIGMSSIRDDSELLVKLQAACDKLADVAAPNLVSVIVSSLKLESWHKKIRALLFLQSYFFTSLFLLDSSQRALLVESVADVLEDEQVEVRDCAADSLSSVIRCSPPKEQNLLVKKLVKSFTYSLGSPKSYVKKRHAAVLGLGALVNAFPYDSPPPVWVPDVLASLAIKASGDSGVIAKSVKQTLSDFKKTRQDTWHVDQTVFSQEQLDDLDGILWKNYFV